MQVSVGTLGDPQKDSDPSGSPVWRACHLRVASQKIRYTLTLGVY